MKLSNSLLSPCFLCEQLCSSFSTKLFFFILLKGAVCPGAHCSQPDGHLLPPTHTGSSHSQPCLAPRADGVHPSTRLQLQGEVSPTPLTLLRWDHLIGIYRTDRLGLFSAMLSGSFPFSLPWLTGCIISAWFTKCGNMAAKSIFTLIF